MKRVYFLVGILAILLCVTAYGRDRAVNSTTADLTFAPASESGLMPAQTLVWYRDRGDFQAACDVLQYEDFEDNNLPDNSVAACSECINETTNDACFSPGDIEPNIDLCAHSFRQMVLSTTGFGGCPSDMVGPNYNTDHLDIEFDVADEINALGGDWYVLLGSTALTITVYGESGSLGSETVQPGQFLGVVADVPIVRVRSTQNVQSGWEFIDNAEFGVCSQVPKGACCFPDGACVEESEEDCGNDGGLYEGDDTTCDPNPCPQPPEGRCCLPDDSCIPDVIEVECDDMGGEFEEGEPCRCRGAGGDGDGDGDEGGDEGDDE
jgi:hypothetical protein